MRYFQNIFMHIWISLMKKNYPLGSAASSKLRPFSSSTKSFKNSFLPYCVNEWNNLKADIRNTKSLNFFNKLIISGKRKIL